jgi:hypothetical protein
MPWIGVGVYVPLSFPARDSLPARGADRDRARPVVAAAFVRFLAAPLRAADFVAFARFFMSRTLQRAARGGQRASRRSGAPVSRVKIHSFRSAAPRPL